MQTDKQLIHFNKARQELALASSVDEVKDIRDKAEALRLYLKQAGEGLEMQNAVAEIKLRAERRAGEMLAEEVKPGNPQFLHDERIATPKLNELGISETQSHRWQLEAEVPEDKFESWIAEIKDKEEELTSIGLRRLALQAKVTQAPVNSPPFPTNQYKTIIIDPPWPIQKILRDVRLKQSDMDYPPMTIDAIKNLPIPALAYKDGSHIYLWVTHKFLPLAFEVFKEWGVNYECLLTWVKNVGFTPYSWMYSTEHCLFGHMGNLPLTAMGKRLDFSAKVREHSRKPDEFYALVKEVSPEPRIDLFAREKRDGYAPWGDESGKY